MVQATATVDSVRCGSSSATGDSLDLSSRTKARVLHHLPGHPHVGEHQVGVAPAHAAALRDDVDVRDVAGLGGVAGVAGLDEGHPVGQVEPADQVGLALMEVDRAVVDVAVRGRLVHGADEAAGGLLDHADGAAEVTADRDLPGRAAVPGVVPAGRPPAQLARRVEVGDRLRGRGAEEVQVGLGQRQLGRRRGQVRAEHVRVGRVEHGGLDRVVEQGVRVVHQVAVERVVAGDEHRRRVVPGPPGPARLLPQRRPGSRPAGDQHRVKPGDVDAELKGAGGGHAGDPPVAQPRLKAAAVVGQVAGAVGGDVAGELLAEGVTGGERDGLRAAPAT